jgi:uncharacterized protein involved in cysteine biosynthesis
LFSALFKAFAQFADPRLRRVLWRSLGLALAVLAALAVGLWLVLGALGAVGIGWIDAIVDVAAGVGVAVVAWLLFPAAVSVTVGLFLEDAAAAVEARHYPDLPPARAQPVGEAVLAGARFAGAALLLNLLVLPLYLALFFIPPLNIFVFYGLNGYLLGREYFELVALRRLDERRVRELRRAQSGRVFVAGVIVTALLTVPVVNLVAPIAATAFMLHLFEGLRRPAA